jgi:hypothetical protein
MSRSYISKALRARIGDQARHRCDYCPTQEAIVGMPMELDHLVPEALGGHTVEGNLWLARSLEIIFRGSCIRHDGVLGARSEIRVAMDRNDDRPGLDRILIRMVATLDPDEDPTVLLQDAAHPFAGYRLHSSIT